MVQKTNLKRICMKDCSYHNLKNLIDSTNIITEKK